MAHSDIRKARVFISYARKDGAFAESLRDKLIAHAFEAYLDKHDIAPGEPWQERLSGLITTADTVVFCLSPHFVASTICDWEVNEAERLGKRLLPVVIADAPAEDVPQRLKRLNYIFMRGAAESNDGLAMLVNALDTDIAWIRAYTRLGERAQEWLARKRAEGALLRGAHITEAEAWIAARPREAPDITVDVAAFVAESRKAETARDKRARRRGRIITMASLTATAIMAVLGWQMFEQWQDAQIRQARVLANYADQQVARGDAVTGMLLALEAMPDNGAGLLERLRPALPEAGVSAYRATHKGAGSWNLAGHGESIEAARLSLDRRHIATVSRDGTARIWDAASGFQQRVLVGHEGPVEVLEFSPDGRLLATGSADRTVRVWDWRAGRLLVTLSGHQAPITRVGFDAQGKHLLSIAEDHAVHVWDAGTGRLVVVAGDRSASDGKFVKLDQAAFLPDGSLLTVGGVLETVARVWNVSSGGGSRDVFKGDRNSQLEVSPDGKRAVRISPARIELTDISTGKTLGTLDAAANTAFFWKRFSPDGSTLAAKVDVGDGVRTPARIDLIDATSGQIRCSTAIEEGGILEFRFDAGSGRLFTYTGSRKKSLSQLAIWDAATCAQLASLERAGTTYIRPNQYAPAVGGSQVLSWDSSAVALWDELSARLSAVHEVRGGSDWRNVALDPPGRLIAGFDGSKLSIFDAATGRLVSQIAGHGEDASAPIFSRDGRRLVTYDANSVTVWDTQSWSRLAEPLIDTRTVYSVELSATGQFVLVTYEAAPGEPADQIVSGISQIIPDLRIAPLGRAIAVQDGREVLLRPGDEARHWAQLISPDGRHDIRDVKGGSSEIFNVVDDRAIAKLSAHFAMVRLSADKNRLVGVRDNTAWVSEFPSGKLVSKLVGNAKGLGRNLAISPDGRRVITAPDFAGQGAAGTTIGPDGRPIAAGADNAKSLWLWNADTGAFIAALTGHTGEIEFQAMSADGRRLITIGRDNSARIWDLETGRLEAVLDLGGEAGRPLPFGSKAAFGTAGDYVLVWASDNAGIGSLAATIWSLAATSDGLVDQTRRRVPRCLGADERRAFFLPPQPPRWCFDLRKWPYHDHAKTPPPPYALGERLLAAWDALGGDAAVAALSRAIGWLRHQASKAQSIAPDTPSAPPNQPS